MMIRTGIRPGEAIPEVDLCGEASIQYSAVVELFFDLLDGPLARRDELGHARGIESNQAMSTRCLLTSASSWILILILTV